MSLRTRANGKVLLLEKELEDTKRYLASLGQERLKEEAEHSREYQERARTQDLQIEVYESRIRQYQEEIS